MNFNQAVTRIPSKTMARGITSSILGKPNHARAMAQFFTYVRTLENCGLHVTVLDPLDNYPDAHFVEDTAVITTDMAIITRPGADARKGEVTSIEIALQPYRRISRIQPPATLDGGDVLKVGNQFLIGLSDRTNRAGAIQLGKMVEPFGFGWSTIPVTQGLHLKSSINWIGENVLLVTENFADHAALDGYQKLVVAPEEAYAANTLCINGHLITPRGFPNTMQKLQRLGAPVIELDTSEFRKMDGGLTCLSLRF